MGGFCFPNLYEDIIFGSIEDDLAQKFDTIMKSELEMTLVGELNFLLDFQIKQQKDGILSQAKYVKELVKKFGLDNATPTWTPISTTLKLH